MRYQKTAMLLFLLFSLGIQSQESVNFSKQKEIVSPEINADHTVTFRLEAKNAKTVSLQSDFTPDGGTFTKDENGIWSFTSKVLAPELYSYNFIVDGVKAQDPNNAFVIRDVANVFNVFLIGGGQADYYKVADVPHGSVSKRWYDSPKLKTTKRLTIYTPPGYEKSTQNYPVLYLLHGAGGDEEAWMELGRTAQIMDNLIAQGKAKPMIVVMPNGNSDQAAAPGEASEGFVKPVFLRPEIFAGKTEAAFVDIIAFVESNYRVKKDKASRALAGLSMGGLQTIVISANNPDMFDYIGVFSSALLQPKDTDIPIYKNMEEKLKTQKQNKFKAYWIAIGDKDFLYKQCTEYRSLLDQIGLKYTYKETSGGHTWSNWRVYLTEFAPLLFQ